MIELVNTPQIAGLTKTVANPTFSKNTFKLFVPKFADYVDSEDGKIESVINLATIGTVITDSATKIDFTNDFTVMDGNKKVLSIDANDDILIGKNTEGCYTEGYNNKSEVILTDTSGLDNVIVISYLLNGVIFKSYSFDLSPLEQITEEIDYNFGNSELNAILTIQISDENNASLITYFKETVTSNFEAVNGDAYLLYEAFCATANNKILKSIWNSDWELAMSFCIAHYIAVTNRETQTSFGLEDIAKDSGPRGLVLFESDRTKYDYKNITLSRNAAKFWQSTEFGRLLITLLDTKGILTMFVAN